MGIKEIPDICEEYEEHRLLLNKKQNVDYAEITQVKSAYYKI